MEINKEIEEKAKDIIVQKHKELEQKIEVKDYIRLCIEAGICPVCGLSGAEEVDMGIYYCKCGWKWTQSTTL